VWDIGCVAEEGEGDVFKDDVWNVIRVERDMGRMSEPGCESALGLVRAVLQMGIWVSGIKLWLWLMERLRICLGMVVWG
jgi:hypothetical protein